MNTQRGGMTPLPDLVHDRAGGGPVRDRRPVRSDRTLLSVWFRVVTAAEFAGFVVPATVGALTAGARPLVAVPALLAAGAAEGAMLGLGQAVVLRRALPSIDAARWIVATAVGAVVAYALGLAPSTLADAVRAWPLALLVVLAVLLGTALLGTIGTAQWLILRHHVPRAGRWIITTGLAWLAGLTAFFGFSTPLWQPGQPVAVIVVIGVAGGLLMAATTSWITGLAVARLTAGSLTNRSANPDGAHAGP